MALLLRIAILLLICTIAPVHAEQKGQWVFPVIEEIGPVKMMPNVSFPPEDQLRYRVLFDVAGAALRDDEEAINPGLEKVARYINTLAVGGVSPENMDIALIVHNKALPLVLKNEFYHQRFGLDNPNLPVIEKLQEAGVALYVCGLNLEDWNYEQDWVHGDFKIALSYLVIVTTLQLNGYAFIPS